MQETVARSEFDALKAKTIHDFSVLDEARSKIQEKQMNFANSQHTKNNDFQKQAKALAEKITT